MADENELDPQCLELYKTCANAIVCTVQAEDYPALSTINWTFQITETFGDEDDPALVDLSGSAVVDSALAFTIQLTPADVADLEPRTYNFYVKDSSSDALLAAGSCCVKLGGR